MMRHIAQVIVTVVFVGAMLGGCAKKQNTTAAKSPAPDAAEPKTDEKSDPADEPKPKDGAAEDPCGGGE